MLDKESIDTYRSIHLNRDLRCEILQRRENRSAFTPTRFIRPAAVLASVILAAGVILLRPASPPSVLSMEGNIIGRKAEIISAESIEYSGGIMRLAASPDNNLPLQTANVCAAFEISAGQDVFITISGGALLLPDPAGIPTFAGQSGSAPDGASVYISLEGCESSSPISVLISDMGGCTISSYRIIYLSDQAVWQITTTKQN